MAEVRDTIRAVLERMGRKSVVDETEAELAVLAVRGPLNRALAASVLVMAHELDNPKPSLAMKAIAAKELREAMDRLIELLPEEHKTDGVDELNARRTARLTHEPAGEDLHDAGVRDKHRARSVRSGKDGRTRS